MQKHKNGEGVKMRSEGILEGLQIVEVANAKKMHWGVDLANTELHMGVEGKGGRGRPRR